MGTVSVANSGQKCLQWSDAAKDEKLKGKFAELTKHEEGVKLEGHFCRAFAADDKPWCYAQGYATPEDAKQVWFFADFARRGIFPRSKGSQSVRK